MRGEVDPVPVWYEEVNAAAVGHAVTSDCPTSALAPTGAATTMRWQGIHNAVLARKPLCCHCAERGRLTAAVLVDHIVPLPKVTHRVDNLHPLCANCHAVKAFAERYAMA